MGEERRGALSLRPGALSCAHRPRGVPSHPHPSTTAAGNATTAGTVGWVWAHERVRQREGLLSALPIGRFSFSLTCQWNRSSPAGPAEHDVGGSFCRSCSSCGGEGRKTCQVASATAPRALSAPAERAGGCEAICAPRLQPRLPSDAGMCVRAWGGGLEAGERAGGARCARREGKAKKNAAAMGRLCWQRPTRRAGGRGAGSRATGHAPWRYVWTPSRGEERRRRGKRRQKARRRVNRAAPRSRSSLPTRACVSWRPPLFPRAGCACLCLARTLIGEESLALTLSRQLAQVALARGARRSPRHPRLHHPRQRPHAPDHRGRARGKGRE